MLEVGTTTTDWFADFDCVCLDEVVTQEIVFNFLATDIRKHKAVDFNTGSEMLPGFFDHFSIVFWIIDNVDLLKVQRVLLHYGTNAFAPATVRFEICLDV